MKQLESKDHYYLLSTENSTPDIFIYSFRIFLIFYSASSSPLLLRGTPNYSIDTVSKLTRRSATGNCEWRTCPRSLHGSWSGIRTRDPPDARHRTYHWATMPHKNIVRCNAELVDCVGQITITELLPFLHNFPWSATKHLLCKGNE